MGLHRRQRHVGLAGLREHRPARRLQLYRHRHVPGDGRQALGAGSQYLWTPRDASGAFLDGANRYRLHIPANIPAKNFWSVVAYDADSRSILRNDQPFPSVSTYTNPHPNADGSIDVHFGPQAPADTESNWIQTVPGKGWFTLFCFYGPLEPFFDQTWKPGDIEPSA
jgi:hypothetical protein